MKIKYKGLKTNNNHTNSKIMKQHEILKAKFSIKPYIFKTQINNVSQTQILLALYFHLHPSHCYKTRVL